MSASEVEKPAGTVFATERWRDAVEEMRPLMKLHWLEVARNHDCVKLDVDEKRYEDMDDSGVLHLLTARRDGKLIGYHVCIVSPHLHYASTLHGFTDVYWVAPEFRVGRTGLRLFEALARELDRIRIERGHKFMKLITATKLHMDQGRLFERLGYSPVERIYSKVIGG